MTTTRHPNLPRQGICATVARAPSALGVLAGAACFAGALTPSLIPRAGLMQGALSGASFAAGYGLAVLAVAIWGFLGLRGLAGRGLRLWRGGAFVCAAAIILYGLWRADRGQQGLHLLMGLPPVETVRPVIILVVAVVVGAMLLVAGRVFAWLWNAATGRLERVFPERLALILGFALAATAFGVVGNDVLLSRIVGLLDRSYQQLDAVIAPDMPQPRDPLASGSAASLVAWDSLGAEGRNRVADPLDGAEIARLTGAPAQDPLRIYVGLGSADTPQERAALALAEALRTGAFDRATLVIATPTGTGWVDPAATYPLEVLTRGDVATVSVQYSYLPSWLSLLTVPEYGAETARAVFAAIHGHWKTLPPDTRPKLYLFGLSLGALNGDLSADVFDLLDAPYDGAFWVGPPFAHRTWIDLTRDREPQSPAWLPRLRDGSVVRFLNQRDMPDADRPWGRMRVVFLQYGSDPITFFSPSTFWRRPAWMEAPLAPDVSPDMRWLPLVTGLQLGFDVMTATTAPRGFGHVYAGEDYLRGWLSLLSPEGVDAATIAAIHEGMAARDL